MKTKILPEQPNAKSPAGADIRFLIDGDTGNKIHSTVPPYQVNKATVHAMVSEFWYILEGNGEFGGTMAERGILLLLFLGLLLIFLLGHLFNIEMYPTKS